MSKIKTFIRPSGTKINIDLSVGNNTDMVKKLGWKEEKPTKKNTDKSVLRKNK